MNAPVTIRLSWPSPKLHSHVKGHWRGKAAATAAYRNEAAWTAKAARVPRDPNARLIFAFAPPDRRRRDLHNLFGPASKAIIDGIADAMGCDDNKFRCRFPETFDERVKGGAVHVTVEPTS